MVGAYYQPAPSAESNGRPDLDAVPPYARYDPRPPATTRRTPEAEALDLPAGPGLHPQLIRGDINKLVPRRGEERVDFLGAGLRNLVLLRSAHLGAILIVMASWDHDPSFDDGDSIDMDRIIVDPDYRRRVIDRLQVEALRRAPPGEPMSALRRDD